MEDYGCIDVKIFKEAYEVYLVRLYDFESFTSMMMAYPC